MIETLSPPARDAATEQRGRTDAVSNGFLPVALRFLSWEPHW